MNAHKPARVRRSSALRSLLRETHLQKENLIQPLFFKEGQGSSTIPSMPSIKKMGEEELLKEIDKLEKLGIKAVLLFGSAENKDMRGSVSYDEKSPFHKALRKIKESSGVILIADVCLCAYTSHGHCGILKDHKPREKTSNGFSIDNEKTLEVLAKIALSYANAGADIVAPSAMADGQVKAIRAALDENDFSGTAIMSYAVKYASCFYGPFRQMYDSSPSSGDRKSYQMDPGNKREALREAMLDEEEGADIIMVKPALAYLDIISAVRGVVNLPVAAYNVSGEYSMIKAAAEKGWLDERTAAMEILWAMKRAGADILITYWAKEAVHWLGLQE